MPLQYKQKETNAFRRISETDTKRNYNHDDEDSLPGKQELVAQIDTNLKHLQGQRKILQYAKEGKTWKDKFSLNDKKNKKNQCNLQYKNTGEQKNVANKSVKVTNSFTQIGPSLNNLSRKTKYHRDQPSPDLKRSHFEQNENLTSDDSNTELKINKNRFSLRKVSSKSQTKNVSKTHSKRLLIQKQKNSDYHSLRTSHKSPRLEHDTSEKLNFLSAGRSPPKRNSYEPQTFQNKNNTKKEIKARSIFTQKSKVSPEFVYTIPNSEKNTDNKVSTLPQIKRRNVDRTASSAIKHAKLSKEILEYVKKLRVSQKITNKEMTFKGAEPEFHSQTNSTLTQPSKNEALARDFNTSEANRKFKLSEKRMKIKQNVYIRNHDTFILVNPETNARMSYNNQQDFQRNNNNMSSLKSINFSETSSLSKTQNLKCIKPNVIDDRTYVCPDNSDENDYLILPYVSNKSEDHAYLNLSTKSIKADSENRDSLFEENTSKSVVVLEDLSSQESLTSRSHHLMSHYEPQMKNPRHEAIKKIDGEVLSSQRTDKADYMAHRLERIWDSHSNSKGPHSSKFETSHNNQANYRSHYYKLEDYLVDKTPNQSSRQKNVQKKDNSKPLTSDQYNLTKLSLGHKPSKLASQASEQQRKDLKSDNNVSRDQLFNQESLQNYSSEENLLQTQNVIDASLSSESNQKSDKGVSFDNPTFKESFLQANLETTGNSSVSKFSLRDERKEEPFYQEISQLSSELHDTSHETSMKTSKFERKEEFNQEVKPCNENNATKKTPLQYLSKEEPELGAILGKPILSNSHIETPKLLVQGSMKSTFESDTYQQDTKQVKIAKENTSISSKASSSTTVPWIPRTKLTFSDNEIQEQIVKQRGPTSLQNYNLKSQSKGNTWQDHPQLKEWKNEFQHKLVSQKNAVIPTTRYPSNIIVDEKELLQKSLPTKLRKHEYQKPSEIQPKRETTTESMSFILESETSSQKNYFSMGRKCVEKEFELNKTPNHSELGALSKTSSNEADLSIKSSTLYNPDETPQKITTKSNETIDAKSISIHKADQEVAAPLSTKFGNSKLGAIPKTNIKEKDLDFKSKFKNRLSIKSRSLTAPSNSFKNQDIPQIRPISESKINTSSERNSMKSTFQKDTPSTQQFVNNKYESKHNGDVVVSKSLRTTVMELESVPKINILSERMSLKLDPELTCQKNELEAQQCVEQISVWSYNDNEEFSKELRSKISNENDFKSNTSSLSLFALPTMYINRDLTQKLPHSCTELNPSAEKMSLELETNQSLQMDASQLTQSDIKKESNQALDAKALSSFHLNSDKISSYLPQNDIKDSESSETQKTLLSQQHAAKTNTSSSDQYSELFLNTNHVVEKNSRTSPSKFKQNSNCSIPSKPSQNLHNQKTNKKLQASSSTVFSADKRASSDVFCQRKFNSVMNFNLKTEIANKQPTEIEKPDKFNQMKPSIPYSHKPSSFPHPKEENPTVIIEAKLSNNKGENIMDPNCIKNGSSSLNEMNEQVVKSEEQVFLSDTTCNQNITIEGVSQEVSDLIQHLQNRVKDCDENVKKQLKTFDKLQKNCKDAESFKSQPLCKLEGNKNEKRTTSCVSKEIATETFLELSMRSDTPENDTKAENSCQCIFCGVEQSTFNDSEEIPSFTGCDCMKEDYYNIMRIAYSK